MKITTHLLVALAVLLLCSSTDAFMSQLSLHPTRRIPQTHLYAEPFEVVLKMPPTGSDIQAKLKFEPVLDEPSEIVEVRYKIPFGLNVEPKNNLALCTKDGEGGEKVGDVLRFTSAWSMGLPRGDGLVTTAASFAGGLQWQCSMFDVMKSKSWQQVVEALTSNVESRTDEVVLLFERPLSESN
mmetsp:Transcript_8824/g.15981  ORF Transcript_8824/g.15981 Transcript_8824/m.15981 type:complete len:183 (+) Transcript_8824:125-673(+)|eukprot:CAMPEP_0202481970 /NCGR_PEP_ID=MMETSP1361-20130828/1433_1 /ASSEMBLY_ACC=CAM_ASM_000849 /TAXON_ID=210615 /ORGANISM="Staurosira complex sp., Strain CCMP2646" /LENGTH=182 /DNA_ID=CAMNT_0049109647 /DNA_START=112 /DNA_END=660 /DNA_ORIENTATION=+